MTALARSLGWWRAGEELFARSVIGLADDDLAAPSLLPGWSRHVLVAHVARNADALVNLLTWARTGVETPMYASAEARAAGITQTARQSPTSLRADLLAASRRLTEALDGLPATAWSALVRTAQGRTVEASVVPWMRCREVWVHAVDLDAAVAFADIPSDLVSALIDDVFAAWARRGEQPDLAVIATDTGSRWGSTDAATTVSAPLAVLAGWLTGRIDAAGLAVTGPLPTLPPWL